MICCFLTISFVYLKVLKSLKFVNRHKIVPVKVKRKIHMMDFFYYASHHLLDKPVIGLNGDIGRIYTYIDITAASRPV